MYFHSPGLLSLYLQIQLYPVKPYIPSAAGYLYNEHKIIKRGFAGATRSGEKIIKAQEFI